MRGKSSHDNSSPHKHPNTRTFGHRRSRELPRTTCNRRTPCANARNASRVICRLARVALPRVLVLDLGLPHASGVRRRRKCFVCSQDGIVPRARRGAGPHVRRESNPGWYICGDAFSPRFENENPLVSMACPPCFRFAAFSRARGTSCAAVNPDGEPILQADSGGEAECKRKTNELRPSVTPRAAVRASARASGNRQIGTAWGGGGRGGRCEARASAPHSSAQTFSSTGRGAVRNTRQDKQRYVQIVIVNAPRYQRLPLNRRTPFVVLGKDLKANKTHKETR